MVRNCVASYKSSVSSAKLNHAVLWYGAVQEEQIIMAIHPNEAIALQ